MRLARHVALMREIRKSPKFCLENLKGRDHSEDIGVDGRIILEGILGWEGVDWIHVVQDRGQWWSVVNIVMNLQVP
jgi:hypothetical protein